jgi:hypothetical protein
LLLLLDILCSGDLAFLGIETLELFSGDAEGVEHGIHVDLGTCLHRRRAVHSTWGGQEVVTQQQKQVTDTADHHANTSRVEKVSKGSANSPVPSPIAENQTRV